MTYSQMRQWGILIILGMSLLAGCAGASPTPDVILPAATQTPLPPQPPAVLPVETLVSPTNTAPPTLPAQANGTDLTTTPDGTVTSTSVVATVNPVDQPFLMQIDRVSVVVGRGTLLEGRVAHGTLQAGGSVEVLGPQNVVLNPAILGIFISSTQQEQVTVGDYAALLVQNVEVTEVTPGMLLAETGAYESYEEALQELQ